MIQSRKIGRARVSRILEYAAPTHDPAFLFPDLPQEKLDGEAEWLAPRHYIPSMNRLIVTIQIWVVEIDGKIILIDTGVGNGKPRATARMNRLNNRVLEWLTAAGAEPSRVTHVLQTHLHMDHTGWNTVLDGDRWVPTFPNARYLIPQTDFRHFEQALRKAPDAVMDDSWADSVMPVVEAGLADMVPDDAGFILGCLNVEPVPGHTAGMLSYRLMVDGEEGLFCADVFHSPLQIVYPELNTAYCALPELARQTRARVLADAADKGTLIMPMHFGEPCCGYIVRSAGGYRFRNADWPAFELPEPRA